MGAIWVALSLGVLLNGCGPSIQSIHEGSVRFEHCYRLDLDPKIAPSHRHACWQQWLAVYSYGQSRDRLEHARSRVAAIESGEVAPAALKLETEPREARQFYISTPQPVNVHASPPPLAPAPVPAAPGDACVAKCQEARLACLERCKETPSVSESGSDAVERKTAPASSQLPKSDKSAGPEVTEESTDSECNCASDYKTCGTRCFE